jgi:excisionase family DNA binding protein
MPKKRSRNVAARVPPYIVQAEAISVRLPQAVAMTGLSRTRLYQMIKEGELRIAKDGNSTLILVESLREAIARRTLSR